MSIEKSVGILRSDPRLIMQNDDRGLGRRVAQKDIMAGRSSPRFPQSPIPGTIMGETLWRTAIPIYPNEEVPERFEPIPQPLLESSSETVWQFDTLLRALIPWDDNSEMLYGHLRGFLTGMARNYYRDHEKHHPQSVDQHRRAKQSHFAEIRESTAFGAPFDKLYKNIGNALRVLAERPIYVKGSDFGLLVNNELNDALAQGLSNRSMDLDISFLAFQTQFDPFVILEFWKKYREMQGYKDPKVSIVKGKRMFTGRNFQVIEEKDASGIPIYRGWKLDSEYADDHTPLVCIRIGTFISDNTFIPSKEHSLKPYKTTFKIELSVRPAKWSRKLARTDRRKGHLSSFADSEMIIQLKSTSLKKMNLVAAMPRLRLNITKNYRARFSLFSDFEIFNDKGRIVELIVRGIKQEATRPGLFDIPKEFAEAAASNINDKLWRFIDIETWRDDIFYTLLAAIHLSPRLVATNLFSNDKLRLLNYNLTEELAHDGADYSLSLGNLWLVFSLMDESQISKFLENLPRQKEYVDNYLKNPDKLENQGLFHFMRALKVAGVPFPDFGGNVLLQAMYLFRHPSDIRPKALAELHETAEILDKLDPENVNDLIIEVIVNKRNKLAELLERVSLPGGRRFIEQLNSMIKEMNDIQNRRRGACLFRGRREYVLNKGEIDLN